MKLFFQTKYFVINIFQIGEFFNLLLGTSLIFVGYDFYLYVQSLAHDHNTKLSLSFVILGLKVRSVGLSLEQVIFSSIVKVQNISNQFKIKRSKD